MYRCLATINKNALLKNLEYLKKISNNAQIVFMVKANAYGHGLKEIAQILSDNDEIYYGVAAIDEANILRKHGVQNRILLFDGGAFVGDAQLVSDLKVTPVLTSLRAARHMAMTLESSKELDRYKVHLKIDTGFVRNGLSYQELLDGRHDEFINYLKNSQQLQVEGVATHFCCADLSGDTFSAQQIEHFIKCINYLQSQGLEFSKVHMANSAAILRGQSLPGLSNKYQVMVRPGLAAYGVSPLAQQKPVSGLTPVMNISAQILAIKKLSKGQGIGYGHTFVASKDCHVAIVAMGYGDGLRRSLSNKMYMLVQGIRAQILGTISMDSCAIDISDALKHLPPGSIKPGQMVCVLGQEGSESISANMLAKSDGTIAYEVLTSIAERITRQVV